MNKTHITKSTATIGKKMAKKEMMMEAPVSMVDTNGLPNPAVETVEVMRDAPAALFMVAAVPPPAMIANVQVIMGLKSTIVETMIAVPARVANGMAIVSNKLSTKGI